jgi:hypothetical protein
VGKFHVEGPKILTELFWEASETTKSVSEVGRLKRAGVAGKLLLLIVKLRSCTLPAVIWIREAFVEEDEADELEDPPSVDGGDGGSEWVAPLWEWVVRAIFVNILVVDKVSGEEDEVKNE